MRRPGTCRAGFVYDQPMNAGRKTVGVLGGMGPVATLDFLQKVVALTPAERDEDHLRILVDNNPHVPSRQAASRGQGEDPGAELANMGRRLAAAGADFLVMPCNLAHVFVQQLERDVEIPLLSIIDAAVDEVGDDIERVGVLAIDGCIDAGLYQGAIERTAKHWLVPEKGELADLKWLVNRVKAGDQGDDVVTGLAAIAAALVERGAQAIIAGCTEIPLVLSADAVGVPLVSSTDALARKTVNVGLGLEPLPHRE